MSLCQWLRRTPTRSKQRILEFICHWKDRPRRRLCKCLSCLLIFRLAYRMVSVIMGRAAIMMPTTTVPPPGQGTVTRNWLLNKYSVPSLRLGGSVSSRNTPSVSKSLFYHCIEFQGGQRERSRPIWPLDTDFVWTGDWVP